jgi:hypothetical protein
MRRILHSPESSSPDPGRPDSSVPVMRRRANDRRAISRTIIISTLCTALLASACSSVQERIESLDFDFDLNAVLDEVRDCDALADRLVGLVERSADAVDELAARSGGRVPETTIRETVDKISVSRFFDLAEQIGCTGLEFRVKAIEDMADIATDTPSGASLIEEVLRELEAQSGA